MTVTVRASSASSSGLGSAVMVRLVDSASLSSMVTVSLTTSKPAAVPLMTMVSASSVVRSSQTSIDTPNAVVVWPAPRVMLGVDPL